MPGRLPVTNWKDPPPKMKDRLAKVIFSRKRQADASPLGLSLLPIELLDLIFKKFCGKELHCVRLVSSEWELASRPFFAAKYLTRSVFWLTSSGVDMLEHLSRKFGPYMQKLFIAADNFTINGLWRALTQYLRYRFVPIETAEAESIFRPQFAPIVVDFIFRPRLSPTVSYLKYQTLERWCRNEVWHVYCDKRQSAMFLRRYACNIVSQCWLRWLRKDVSRLAPILEQLPQCGVHVVNVRYEPDKLANNTEAYGKPAPEHALELALYCSGNRRVSDAKYSRHVERVVEKALKRRKLVA